MSTNASSSDRSLLVQGWFGLALFLALGFVLESLMAWKTPAYLDDPIRRELLRLAHTHGALLHTLLLVLAATKPRLPRPVPPALVLALRLGAILMPAGFLLGGLWHPEGDPGHGIWLVPAGALLALAGVVGAALCAAAAAGASGRREKG
jgi:hypothetical protein